MLSGDPTPGDKSGPASYEYAPDPDEVLVAIDNAGGYVPSEITLRNTADVMVLGDGTTIVAGERATGSWGSPTYRA